MVIAVSRQESSEPAGGHDPSCECLPCFFAARGVTYVKEADSEGNLDVGRLWSRPIPLLGAGTKLAALPGAKALRFLAGLTLGLAGGLALLVALLPKPFGLASLVVVSGSMAPTLNVGDIAVARPVEPRDLQLGDVVTYSAKRGLITHRIVGLDLMAQGAFFQMKGDANLTTDPQAISAERIVGKVVFRVPRIGLLMSVTDSMTGVFFMIVVPLLLLALFWGKGTLRKPPPLPHLPAFFKGFTLNRQSPRPLVAVVEEAKGSGTLVHALPGSVTVGDGLREEQVLAAFGMKSESS